MTDAPNISAMSGPQAQAHLDGLLANSEWSAKLAARGSEEYAQLKALSHRINGVPEPTASESPIELLPAETFSAYGGPTLARGEQLELIEQARQLGYDDGRIAEWLSGVTSSPELIEAAKARWSELESDPQFRQALVKGEPAARRKLRAYSTIMAAA